MLILFLIHILFLGTTWIQELVRLIYNNGDINKCRSETVDETFTYLELNTVSVEYGLEQVIFLFT
jgi:hypothetical protein